MHTLQTSLFENSLDKKGLTVKQAMYVTSPLLEHTHEYEFTTRSCPHDNTLWSI